jgi:hypothetical protein
VSAESLVGVDDSEAGSFPADLADLCVQVPDGLGDEEVVVLNFADEVGGGDVEVSVAAVEVEVGAVGLGDGSLPGRVISVGVEGVYGISPGIVEALDFLVVLLLAHGDDQVFVLDDPAVAEDDLVLVGVEAVDAHVVRLSVVLVQGLPGGGAELEFGDAG